MKTFVEFSNDNKLTDKQSELCFNAWNTACDNKNKEITVLKEREKKLVQALKSAIPSLFGSEPELHKRALLVLKELGVTDV